MPLTAKGKKIKRSMRKTYKTGEKTDEVFYASKKTGTIKGVCKKKR